jgi:hypothetical protein
MSARPILWVVVALGGAVIVTTSVLTAREKSAEELAAEVASDEEDDEEGCCGGPSAVVRPAIETLGRPEAPVKVVGFVPDSTRYDEVLAMLRELAGNHVAVVSVTLHSDQTVKAKEEMAKLGHEGPGFFVNGEREFELPDADGGSREVVFDGAPGSKYKPEHLKAVIERAMASAPESVPEPDGGAAPAHTADDGSAEAPPGKVG